MIASGDKIGIQNQPWLENDDNPYITSVSQAFDSNMVSSLMKVNQRGWDEEIIRDLFNERDQQCILNLTIRENLVKDKIYWNKEASEIYSVKSAYRFLQEQKV